MVERLNGMDLTLKVKKLEADDQLNIVLKVENKESHMDRTVLREISLVGPDRNIQVCEGSKQLSHFENNLQLQTIPIRGSHVRIFGRDIPTGNSITIDDENISLVDNKFVVEKLLPENRHDFGDGITDSNQETYEKSLSVNLKSDYLFMMGIADITLGEGKVSGNLETLSDGDEHLDGDIFVDGLLAFYLKGKVRGKYLVTAQMDTRTAEIDAIFDNTNSQGKIYLRVERDKSVALWGNYNTDITGTELSSFNRSLYGVKLDHRSTKTTSDGEHKTDLTVFASEAQSAFRHNEFRGTGGSLYYLKDTDIVDGSERYG